ncbi:MAG: exosortase C-terminal domain/associated protein EpsI [Actinomycetota bacterium]
MKKGTHVAKSLHRYRLLALNGVLLLVVAGSHWGRRIDAATLPDPDLFKKQSVQFRNWKTTDLDLSAAEREMLQPDAVMIRRFDSGKGPAAELAVVAGHRKQSIHTPGFCMTGGGWELSSQRQCRLDLPGGPVTATRALMFRKGARVVATYFFTDGRYSTPNLVRFQGAQLVKRLQAEVPLGALVRILVPSGEDVAAAEKLSDDFASATVPHVMERLREARLEVR